MYDETVSNVLEDVRKRQLNSKSSRTRVQALMTSKTVQNELIDIIGTSILKGIVDDVKEAGKFVLISDETTLHNKPYLTMGLRYVNQAKKKVVEDFITFQELESGKAEAIFDQLLRGLEEANLPIG